MRSCERAVLVYVYVYEIFVCQFIYHLISMQIIFDLGLSELLDRHKLGFRERMAIFILKKFLVAAHFS